jgi:hypothetical protein
MRNHRLSCDTHFDYLGMMRLCISIASILLVTTPAVAAVITVREHTPDRPIVVVVEGTLTAFGIRFTLLSSRQRDHGRYTDTQSRLAAYFADTRMFALTLIHEQ